VRGRQGIEQLGELVGLEGLVEFGQGIQLRQIRVPVVPDFIRVHASGGQVGGVPEKGRGHEQIEVGQPRNRGVIERRAADLRPQLFEPAQGVVFRVQSVLVRASQRIEEDLRRWK
jgi:hypothetical protein